MIQKQKNIPVQRLLALFFMVLFTVSIALPPLSVYAEEAQARTRHARDIQNFNKKMAQNYPGAMEPVQAEINAAADAMPLPVNPLDVTKRVSAPMDQALQVPEKPKVTPQELTDKRTATSSTSLNADGTLTEKHFFKPKFYKENNSWKTIDTTLEEDKNAGDSGNPVGRAFGQMQSWLSSTTNFKVKANDWQARFGPSDRDSGMIRIQKGDEQIGFLPVDAKKVAPVVTTKDGVQTVHYYDLWPGVNVEYTVEPDGLKENIVIKDKDATSKVSFKLVGASLEEPKTDDKAGPAFVIKGVFNDEYGIAPANLILNNYGHVTQQGVFEQTHKDGVITISVDKSYLQNLPDGAFPAVIDPLVSNFGTRTGGNYISFNNSGYICYSNVCNLYAGTNSSTGALWRGAFHAPYWQLSYPNIALTNARLHLKQRSNESFWTGDWGTHNFQVGRATCLNNINCVDAIWANASFAAEGDIDVTSLYQSRMAAGDWDAWLMVMGEDGTNHSFKNFDPGNGGTTGSYVEFTYSGPPQAPSIVTPTNDQVFTDPQPSFRTNTVPSPSGGAPLRYELFVSSAADASAPGSSLASGWLDVTQWTIPDGILQDGTTYYVRARSYDPTTSLTSGWGAPVPFRIDMRTGKDKTQTYDSFGAMDVDLATGNVTTGAASHASAALGGSLGITLDYNSPLKSRNGLVGQYWDNATMSGTPKLTRVDQNIDFHWGSGSPESGTIPNDNFSGRWTGYFIAPTTGSYEFGAVNDDTLRVEVNSQQVYNNSGCYSTLCYGTPISLTEGQVVPILVEHTESTGYAYARLWVKGVVDEQAVPTEWLRTGVRAVTNQQGLVGRYYFDDSTHTFDDNKKFMERTDSLVSYSWGIGAPVANGPTDAFLARWTGYFTAPVGGTYEFGTDSDDGSRIYVNGNPTPVMNKWQNSSGGAQYGSGVTLTAGQSVPITVEYFENTGNAHMYLLVRGAVAEQIVPSKWLSPKAQVLPDGWNLGVDPDGNVSYDRIRINQNSAVITDSTGSTHEYTWSNGNYKPPVNEDGHLVRNDDGTFTLQDVDGRTYVFNADGTLASATNPLDDRKPAALQYTYASVSGGAARLTQITDAVDTNRWAKVYYSGDSQCGSAPSGYDANAPAGMLCAVETNDGRATYFYYNSGQLARIAKPGNEFTDYQYEAVTNGSTTIGYRLVAVRDSLANDAVAASVRANDDTVKTQLSYDVLGRATTVTQPAATSGANRIQHSVEYLPGALDKSYYGKTKQHVTGATEPNGFSRQITYDALFRTMENTDIANQTIKNEWEPLKDLLFSSTDATDLKATTIYDDEDRPIESYGPAPKAWFGADRKPTTTYASQVPRNDVKYDESITGPSVAWYNAKGKSLIGPPKLHTTGFGTSANTSLARDFTTNASPITPDTGMDGYGFSATGKVRLPGTGTGSYTVKLFHDDGARLWINDHEVINDWNYRSEGTAQNTNTFSFNAEAGKPYRFRLDYFHTGNAGAIGLCISGSGISNQSCGVGLGTHDWTFLSPGYNLTTSTKTYDSTIGDTTVTTNYGSNPELGLAQSTTVDPTGLNLTTSATYETQGATGSFLRQTSKTLPGGGTTNYAYYTATETRDNPCTTGTAEAFKQAGFVKTKTEADPDGSGGQTGRVTETVYDDAGRVLASRYNADNWTCSTYDTRGRTTQVDVPAFNGAGARTITYNYATWGSPLATSVTDSEGTMTTTIDLLGRVTEYIDTLWTTTTNTYDNFGRLTQRSSPLGTENFVYDNYNRLTEQKLDSTTYAKVYYDTYSRVDYIEYPNAGQQKLTLARDSLGRVNGHSYTLGNGSAGPSDSVTRSQSGQVISGTELGIGKSYEYDKAGRLTVAQIGSNNRFEYDFTAPTSCWGDANANAHKNSNRTALNHIVNSTPNRKVYCYDAADRLYWSDNGNVDMPTYDSHGNTTRYGMTSGGSTQTELSYDSSDRVNQITQNITSQPTTAVFYSRDAQGRIKSRDLQVNWQSQAQHHYGYTTSSDTPDFLRDNSWNIVEKYLQLPGGVLLTVRTNSKVYSLPNIHGDNFATTDASGVQQTTTLTGPFGEPIAGQTGPNNTATGSVFGWEGQHEKLTESQFTLLPLDMGARTYLPTLGRFVQVDPQEGGNQNNYIYPTNPVNAEDLNGLWWSWKDIKKTASSAGKAVWSQREAIVAIAGTTACVVGTGGVCLGVAVAGAAFTGVVAGAATYSGTGSLGSAVKSGGIRAVTSFTIDRVAGKVAGANQVVRHFGTVNGTARHYKSATTALATGAGKSRAIRQVWAGGLTFIGGKLW